jgi:hypothetical protein
MSAIAAAIVTSAAVGAYGARKGAKAQEKATEQATDVQRQIFERQTELAEPFRQAGITSQNELMRLLGIGGDKTAVDYGMLTRGFRPEDLTMDPGYAFRLAEGEKALARMQSARGGGIGLASGRAIREGVRYAGDLASQEYMNAFNRAQAQLGTRLGALGSLYGAGQTAAQQVAGQAGEYGSNVGNLLMAGGAARASGYAGMANALNQALGQGLNYYQGQQWLKRMYPTGGTTGGDV